MTPRRTTRKPTVLEPRALRIDELARITGGEGGDSDLTSTVDEDGNVVRIPVRIKRVP